MGKFHIDITDRVLHFKHPAGTSRGVYTTRHSYFLTLTSDSKPGVKGIGECATLPDLSCDTLGSDYAYARTLRSLCDLFCATGQINYDMWRPYPSMLFGLKQHWLSGMRMVQANSLILLLEEVKRVLQ